MSAPARTGQARAAWPGMVAALAAQELRLAVRRGESLLITFAIPVGLLVAFAGLDVAAGTTGRAIDFLLPGTIALAVVAASLVALGIATGYERAYGVLKRLGASPAPRSAVIAGKVLSVSIVQAVQAGALVGIAVLVFGWSPPLAVQPLTVAAALVLGTGAFAGIGLLLAGTLRAEATLALTNALFLVTLLIGDMVVPLDRLPAAIGELAALLPPATLAETLRIGLGSVEGDVLAPLLRLGAWALATTAAATARFRWE
jgi:ABC-2 type transport system permease protein